MNVNEEVVVANMREAAINHFAGGGSVDDVALARDICREVGRISYAGHTIVAFDIDSMLYLMTETLGRYSMEVIGL